MNRTGYTPEFWLRAIELQLRLDKVCEKCNRQDGWIPMDDKKKHVPLKVIVGLRFGETPYTANLGLFCTRCRRGKYQVKIKKSELDKLILPLFPEMTI